MSTKSKNEHESRELWLKAAAGLLRSHFADNGYELPENIRFAIGFTSSGRTSKRAAEMWLPATSQDQTFELFIRPDKSDPVEVLELLTAKLVHTVAPEDAGHGKPYKDIANKIGLHGKMRDPKANNLLAKRLADIAEQLGPLPHAALDISLKPDGKKPVGRPRKQKARLIKAECSVEGCGYNVRMTALWIRDLGPPICPRHGDPLIVEAAPADIEQEAADETDAGERLNAPSTPAPEMEDEAV